MTTTAPASLMVDGVVLLRTGAGGYVGALPHGPGKYFVLPDLEHGGWEGYLDVAGREHAVVHGDTAAAAAKALDERMKAGARRVLDFVAKGPRRSW